MLRCEIFIVTRHRAGIISMLKRVVAFSAMKLFQRPSHPTIIVARNTIYSKEISTTSLLPRTVYTASAKSLATLLLHLYFILSREHIGSIHRNFTETPMK